MSPDSQQPGSITRDLRKVQDGDTGDAAHNLFTRNYQQVTRKARKWAKRLQVADASDVAISVWDTILRGMPQGKYPCQDRREFEELLGKITFHKAVNLYNWVKRPRRHPSMKLDDEEILKQFCLDEDHRKVAELYYLAGKTTHEVSVELGIDEPQVEERLGYIRKWLQKYRYRPTSHAAQAFALEAPAEDQPLDMLLFQELLLSLDEKLRDTVLLKLQGHSNQEIADLLDVSKRQIERRLKLVHDTLEAELSGD